jgi:hypothetical protein
MLKLIDSITTYLDDNVVLPLLEALTLDHIYVIDSKRLFPFF